MYCFNWFKDGRSFPLFLLKRIIDWEDTLFSSANQVNSELPEIYYQNGTNKFQNGYWSKLSVTFLTCPRRAVKLSISVVISLISQLLVHRLRTSAGWHIIKIIQRHRGSNSHTLYLAIWSSIAYQYATEVFRNCSKGSWNGKKVLC